ncbi:transmembrane signal receptor [Lithospermum erythrorhizon]|uniref:Transmembrane signal receptor n=1 Tax=Lithospermum erythrorhizon TaxID=34254 RepID=A0AAV3RHQ6_LITER
MYTAKQIVVLLPIFLLTQVYAYPIQNHQLPSDAVYLLSFKTKADKDNNLHYNLNEHFDYCQWQGVKCVHGRVVRFALQSLTLRGTFQPDTLSRLDHLRILILRNNSLTGPLPDLSAFKNLKTLFLDRNFFSGFFPPSILFLHQLINLDLAHNNFTGSLPVEINRLDRLVSLRLESNRFTGSIPPLNQTTLTIFNVSDNNLTGPVPLTLTLKKFKFSSFKSNPNLCGDVVNKPCSSPFFNSGGDGGGAASPAPVLQNARSEGEDNNLAQTPHKHRSKIGVVLGILIAFLILIAAILSIFALIKRRGLRIESNKTSQSSLVSETSTDSPENYTNPISAAKEAEKFSIPPPRQQAEVVVKSGGDLRFCSGEAEVYTMEQLMRGSAELLGRGTLGTTYKAVMDNRLIVCVKRLDATKAEGTSGEAFESHLEGVGVLRHPNLVPVRAYFQAKQERLIIYDYQPNGSLFNLIHGKYFIIDS